MTYTVCWELGDRSGDGHGKTQTVYLTANYPHQQIWDAYQKSCEQYEERFEEDPPWEDYEWFMTIENADKVKEFGVHYCIERYLSIDQHCNLLMEFAKLNLPDLTWNVIENPIPVINNATVGYGMLGD